MNILRFQPSSVLWSTLTFYKGWLNCSVNFQKRFSGIYREAREVQECSRIMKQSAWELLWHWHTEVSAYKTLHKGQSICSLGLSICISEGQWGHECPIMKLQRLAEERSEINISKYANPFFENLFFFNYLFCAFIYLSEKV